MCYVVLAMFISLFEKIDFVGVYSIYYATFFKASGTKLCISVWFKSPLFSKL